MTRLHAHIEVKLKNKWFHYGAPAINADYTLFAFINGNGLEHMRKSIAADIHPCASINGLPEDLSKITKISYNQDKTDGALYEEGCLTSEDLCSLQTRMQDFAGIHDPWWECSLESDIFGTYINNKPIADHTGYDDSRVVFWFSN